MQCADLDRIASAVSPREIAQNPEAARHLGHCKRCRLLYGDWSEALPETSLPRSVKESIVGALLADLSPVQPQPPAFRLAATILLILAAIVAVMVALMGVGGLRLMSAAQALSLAAVGVFSAALLSIGLVTLMHPGRERPRLAQLGLIVLVAGFCGLVLFLFSWSEPRHFWRAGLRCFGAALMMTVPAAALIAKVMRRGYVLNGPLAGAAAGGLGVLAAAIVLQIFCPEQHAGHLLAWHGGALVAAIGAGFVLGRRLRT